MFAEIKRRFLKRLHKIWLSPASLQLPSDCWDFFLNKWIWQQSFEILLQTCQKNELSGDSDQKMKESLYLDLLSENDQLREHHVLMNKKEACIDKNLRHQCHFSSFLLKKIIFFSYQLSISTTKPHDWHHYRLRGQTHLWRLCGHWKTSR